MLRSRRAGLHNIEGEGEFKKCAHPLLKDPSDLTRGL